MRVKTFDVVIEQDVSGAFVGSVPALLGCYSQGATEKELLRNMKEAITLHLETQKHINKHDDSSFIRIKKVAVHAETSST